METSRLVLEPWDACRIEAFVDLAGDAGIMQYIGRGGPWSRAMAVERFGAMVEHWRVHGFGWRSVVEKHTQAWLGLIALNHLGPGITGVEADEIEIGWWLVRGAWHRGIATEGARAACGEAFGRLGAARLVARCQPANHRSLAVMERIGMAPWRQAVGRHGEALAIHRLDRARWDSPA